MQSVSWTVGSVTEFEKQVQYDMGFFRYFLWRVMVKAKQWLRLSR